MSFQFLWYPLISSYEISLLAYSCAGKQSGGLGSSAEALDGIVGFGQANSSMLSQLASAGKVKKIFAHCLDSVNGGGIFAIGEVVQPTVNATAIVPNQYVTQALQLCLAVFTCCAQNLCFVCLGNHMVIPCT